MRVVRPAVACCLALSAVFTVPLASATEPGGGSACRAVVARQHAHPSLDGMAIGSLPAGLGALVSDFAYEWGDVSFRSRAWESGPDVQGAYRVDLKITVLRGPTLHDASAVRSFLAWYLERDPDTWARAGFRHWDGPGYQAEDEMFWLAEPGVAVLVKLDQERFSQAALQRTACGVRARPG